jgi:molybdate-binding protein
MVFFASMCERLIVEVEDRRRWSCVGNAGGMILLRNGRACFVGVALFATTFLHTCVRSILRWNGRVASSALRNGMMFIQGYVRRNDC